MNGSERVRLNEARQQQARAEKPLKKALKRKTTAKEKRHRTEVRRRSR
jgi:hypothetical protein